MKTTASTNASHQFLPLTAIVASKTNPRTHFDKTKLDELADSIGRLGVLQPILVRPIAGAKAGDRATIYELVAGERRFRASKLAKLEMIPAIVRELDDKQTLEIQVVENLQREDLHPLEEAEGYALLLKKHGYDADSLALKIGKSRSYVYGRIKLAELSKAAKDAMWNGDLSHSIGLLLARLPKEMQDDALDEITNSYDGPMSFRQAKDFLEDEFFLRLSDAPWKLDDATLVPKAGPCTTCPFRTGNQTDLFGDVAKSADACTNPGCFAEKGDAFWELTQRSAEKGGARILSDTEAKKAFDNWGVKRNGPYVEASSVCYEDAKTRTYSAIVGKSLKPFLARSQKGKVIKLYERTELTAALKSAGVVKAAQRSASEDSWQKQQRIRQEKAKLDRAVEQAIVEELRPKLAQLPLGIDTLRIFTKAITIDRYYHLEAWLKAHGVTQKDLAYGKREKFIAGLIDKMKTAGEMFAIIAEALLKFSPNEMRSEAEKTMAPQLCELVGVDAKSIEKRIRTEAAAKKKTSAVKKAKKTKAAKNAKTKAIKQPAIDVDEIEAEDFEDPRIGDLEEAM